MQVELYCGDLGRIDVDLNADNIENIDAYDLKKMFEKLRDSEQIRFLSLISANLSDEKKAIREILQRLDMDNARAILDELNDEFLSLDAYHARLKELAQ